MDVLLIVLAMIVLLLLQGFFSGAEIALVNSEKAKLRHRARQGHRSSKLALRMFEKPEIILSTTLVGTNIALVVLTVLATTLMFRFFGEAGELYAFLIFTPLILLLGEVVPKSVYQQQADELTPRIIHLLYGFWLLFFPAVLLFSCVARLAARLAGGTRPGPSLFAVREQLRAVLETVEGAANIDVFDRTRIRNVIRFGELAAGDVMIPAREMTAIDAGHSIADAMSLVRRSGYTHIPVFEGARNNVVGTISMTVWDLMNPELTKDSLAELIEPAYYVSEEQPVAELLPVLRAREDQCAIVVDEFGTAIGLITADRILESVVGNVEVGKAREAHGMSEKPRYETVGEDVYLMDARLPISDANDVLGTNIAGRAAHTIGGLMMERLHHVPREGEHIEESGFLFTVEQATDRAITSVRVERAARA